MSEIINIEGVRRGNAHLRRAVELGKQRGNRPARAVPISDIIADGATTMTVDELATTTRLAPITIRRDIKSGRLKAANGGGKSAYRISLADAESWWRARGGGELFGDGKDDTRGAAMPQSGADLEELEAMFDELNADADTQGAPLPSRTLQDYGQAVASTYGEREGAQ
jgi:hypothetical protein